MSNSGGEVAPPEASGFEGTLLPKPGGPIHPIDDHRRDRDPFGMNRNMHGIIGI
jgi:hypothetical protein